MSDADDTIELPNGRRVRGAIVLSLAQSLFDGVGGFVMAGRAEAQAERGNSWIVTLDPAASGLRRSLVPDIGIVPYLRRLREQVGGRAAIPPDPTDAAFAEVCVCHDGAEAAALVAWLEGEGMDEDAALVARLADCPSCKAAGLIDRSREV